MRSFYVLLGCAVTALVFYLAQRLFDKYEKSQKEKADKEKQQSEN